MICCYWDDASSGWIRIEVEVREKPAGVESRPWWEREIARVRVEYGITGMPLILREAYELERNLKCCILRILDRT